MVETISTNEIERWLVSWVNAWESSPVRRNNYEFIGIAAGEETGMALSMIQSDHITRRYILGGYQAVCQFKVIYRIKPGNSNDKRLAADELLNAFGDWACSNPPDLGDGVHVLRVEPTTRSSKFAAYPDGYEDYQILMKLTYEVI